MTELKGAPFDRLALDLVPGAGSCEECPKRTGNCPGKYPDARADVCMDPECYRAKVEAHYQKEPGADGAQEVAGPTGGRGPRPYRYRPPPPTSTRADREVVLEAADAIGRPFTEVELILASWRAEPQRFGLKGFEDQHPDARKVDLCLHGPSGLMLAGVLVPGKKGMIEVADR